MYSFKFVPVIDRDEAASATLWTEPPPTAFERGLEHELRLVEGVFGKLLFASHALRSILGLHKFSILGFACDASLFDVLLRVPRYCWCDCFAQSALQHGIVHRFYVIEITFAPWNPKAADNRLLVDAAVPEMWPVFQNEDGHVFLRRNASTDRISIRTVGQMTEQACVVVSDTPNNLDDFYLACDCECDERMKLLQFTVLQCLT